MRNHEHNSTRAYPRYAVASTVASLGHPAPTMTTPKKNSPFITPPDKDSDAYARELSKALPKKAPKRCGLKLASFFCGCGGVDLGFRSAGFELAFANDLYKRAAESFDANLGHKPLLSDIREVDPMKHIPEVDVLTGGFPCVTFSMAGKRAGIEDSTNGMLYKELCRMVVERKPRYFVAENVKGMISSNGGRDILLILAEFLRLGYRTKYELINMAEHGVPQTRERVIFVGVRLDQWRGAFNFPPKTHRLIRDKKATKWLPVARTLQAAVGDLPDVEGVVGMMHGDAAEKLKRGQGSGINGFSNSKPRAAGDVPHSQTTQANVLMFKKNMRRMTVRECARVQSFPDWFDFKGSMSDGYRQVGNAVPPLYAKALAKKIIEYDKRKIIA